MNDTIKFFSILAVAVIICGLSACGKISDPVPYPDSGYPHSYPHN